jgi:hypothetical protein
VRRAGRRNPPGATPAGRCGPTLLTPETEETPATDVMTGKGQDPAELSAADQQVLREPTERARAGGLRLTGEGELLGKLTKMVVEGALDDHLGYGRHDPGRRTPGAPSPPCPGCRTRPWRRSQPAPRIPAPAGTGACPRPRSRPTAGPARLSSRPRSCPPPACATVGRYNPAPGRDDHHRRVVSGPQGRARNSATLVTAVCSGYRRVLAVAAGHQRVGRWRRSYSG